MGPPKMKKLAPPTFRGTRAIHTASMAPPKGVKVYKVLDESSVLVAHLVEADGLFYR